MKLHLIEDLIDRFISFHLKSDDFSWHYPHSLSGHFHQSWQANQGLSLYERYDLALRSDISQRWWKRENYRPKEIMLNLIRADPELAAIAFKDLSNDTASLEGRLSRFNFYAEELLGIHRKNHLRNIETYHHQDAAIISLYLAGWFPDKYALYPGLDIFQAFCRMIGSPGIPVIDDLVRFNKVATVIFKFLQKDPQFEKLVQKRSDQVHSMTFFPFQTTFEIISFAAPQKNLL